MTDSKIYIYIYIYLLSISAATTCFGELIGEAFSDQCEPRHKDGKSFTSEHTRHHLEMCREIISTIQDRSDKASRANFCPKLPSLSRELMNCLLQTWKMGPGESGKSTERPFFASLGGWGPAKRGLETKGLKASKTLVREVNEKVRALAMADAISQKQAI